jgi:hypothetical protein
LSAPAAAASAGPAWFATVTASAASGFPNANIRATLDCGSMAGHALAALRHGMQSILYDGAAFDALADIARQTGASVSRNRPVALDLGGLPDPDDSAALRAACRKWLRG